MLNSVRLLAVAVALCALPSGFSAVKPAALFSDHMVLQRDRPVCIWGSADPGEQVTLEFAGQRLTGAAGEDGKWELRLAPLAAERTGTELVIKGKNTVTLKNVLVGDIWLCSGQSNMQWTFGKGCENGEEARRDSVRYPLIRAVKCSETVTNTPTDEVRLNRPWVVCNPQTLDQVTAVGYYFARELQRETGIPIGILDNNWGGCQIEPYISRAGFAALKPEYPAFQAQLDFADQFDLATETGKENYRQYLDQVNQWSGNARKQIAEGIRPANPPEAPWIRQRATGQFNGMIAPLARFPIKGVIWYQGESNGWEREDEYFYKLKALIHSWRTNWSEELPFYVVQLAALGYVPRDLPPEGGGMWTQVRDAQRRVLTLPGTGLAVAVDIGDAADIHPRNKYDVGKRLALWALRNEYGRKDLVPSGPLFREMKVENGKVRLAFDYVGSGLMAGCKNGLKPTEELTGGKLSGFAVAGADKIWHWGDAVIEGDTVVVSSPKVPVPAAIRYAYRCNPGPGANLYNREGLPASPFRTDDWKVQP